MSSITVEKIIVKRKTRSNVEGTPGILESIKEAVKEFGEEVGWNGAKFVYIEVRGGHAENRKGFERLIEIKFNSVPYMIPELTEIDEKKFFFDKERLNELCRRISRVGFKGIKGKTLVTTSVNVSKEIY